MNPILHVLLPKPKSPHVTGSHAAHSVGRGRQLVPKCPHVALFDQPPRTPHVQDAPYMAVWVPRGRWPIRGWRIDVGLRRPAGVGRKRLNSLTSSPSSPLQALQAGLPTLRRVPRGTNPYPLTSRPTGPHAMTRVHSPCLLQGLTSPPISPHME